MQGRHLSWYLLIRNVLIILNMIVGSVLFCCTLADTSVAPQQLKALQEIYDALGGSNWSWKTLGVERDTRPKWFENGNEEPCKVGLHWLFLECDEATAKIISTSMQFHLQTRPVGGE